MSLLYAVALLSVSTALLRVLYVVSRMPKTPWWAGESTMHCLLIPAVGMISFGLVFLLEFVFTWNDQVIGFEETLVTAGIVATSIVVWLLMGRVSAASIKDAVVPMPQPPSVSAGHGPSSTIPEHPRKAA